jgi:hypothetical protein
MTRPRRTWLFVPGADAIEVPIYAAARRLLDSLAASAG